MNRFIPLLSLVLVAQSCVSNGQVPEKQKRSKTVKAPVFQDDSRMSFCRFARIIDTDGSVNLRASGTATSTIIGTIPSGEAVYIFEDSGTDWLSVTYTREPQQELSGYLHRSRINYINTLQPIPSVLSSDTDVYFQLDTIAIQIRTEPFDPKASGKDLSTDTAGFNRYKGRFMMGTDGSITAAKTQYQSITVSVGNQTIPIPQQDLEDLFNANNECTECYYDPTDRTLYIHLSNSDGSGSYVVLLTIRNGSYTGRQVALPF